MSKSRSRSQEPLLELERNATEKLFVQWREFNGHDYLDLRIHYTDDDGETWKPTKKGITLKDEMLEEVIQALQEAHRQAYDIEG